MAVLLIGVLLLALFVLSTAGRRHHPVLDKLRDRAYAHRGLHGDNVPENSMEAFRIAKNAGYGVELDVHLLADGNLAVIHDSNLKRTTGKEGVVEDLTVGQLKDHHLNNTGQTIPEFCSVLELFAGEVPIIVELKAVGDNYRMLCEAVSKALDRYNGVYCVESFDPRCVYWLRRNHPDIVRGQLAENYFASQSSKLPWFLKFILKNQMLNFLTHPDFVAYKYCDRRTISNTICRRLWGIQGVTWTVESQDQFDTAVSEGWIPIFEGFTP